MTKTVLGIIGGSGVYDISGLEHARWERVTSPWGEPSDQLLYGTFKGVDLVFLPRHGRGHIQSPTTINYRANIDVLKRAGVTDVISMSACGSFKEELAPGTFVIVDQFIDRTFAREKTFFGEGFVAHVSMAHPIDPKLADALYDAVREVGVPCAKGGTYLAMEGPQFSTLAESLLYKSWGCSVIGMTAMPEAKLAREAELPYALVAMVTDYDCWHPSHDHVTVDQVIKVLTGNAENARKLVMAVAPKLGPDRQPSPGIDNVLDTAFITAPEKRDQTLFAKLDAVAGESLEKMTADLKGVKVTITHFAENYPPGIVGCEFADIDGHVWKFEIKFYDVSDYELDADSAYPRPGVLGCELLSRRKDSSGRDVAEIETDWPSLENQDRFHIFADQLTTSVTQVFVSRRYPDPVPLSPVIVVTGTLRESAMDFKSAIRTIPDFPQPGVQFRDVTTLFGDDKAFRAAIDEMVGHYKGVRIDKVAGIEARGFILGGAIAHQLGVGFVPIRKKGKLPYGVLGEDYDLEYGKDRIEIHIDAVKEGDAVVIVDDLIATGGTCFAAIKLMQRAGAKVIGCCFLVDLPDLGGSGKIRAFGQDVKALVSYEGH